MTARLSHRIETEWRKLIASDRSISVKAVDAH